MARRICRLPILCGLFLALSAASAGAKADDTPGISPATQFTPLVSRVLTRPQAVKATDGNFHLAYELLLTNAIGARVSVETLELRDGTDGRVVLSLTGEALQKEMVPIGGAGQDAPRDRSIESSASAIVWLDVTAESKEDIPKTIDHHVIGQVITPAGPHRFESILSSVEIDTSDPVVLASPVSPGIWLMSEGCCKDFTHHRHGLAPIDGGLYVPQRFAIDFFRLDDEHRTWIGDPQRLDSYLSYDTPVFAAADGVVVASSDGRPDQKPPEPPPIPPIGDTVGNHVIIEVRPGVHLLYAHMKPGSLMVKGGDRVTLGQQIGRIGTTGNSTTPHLHFQVLTRPTFFPSDSLPYVFDRFDLVGHETERVWDDNLGLRPDGAIPYAPAKNPGPRRYEMPLDRDIVRFD